MAGTAIKQTTHESCFLRVPVPDDATEHGKVPEWFLLAETACVSQRRVFGLIPHVFISDSYKYNELNLLIQDQFRSRSVSVTMYAFVFVYIKHVHVSSDRLHTHLVVGARMMSHVQAASKREETN